jgi:hypothetical protein
MKLFIALILCLTALNAASGPTSKVPATAPGFTIPNTHIIDADGKILRGMAQDSKSQNSLKIVKLAETGALSLDNLDEEACDQMKWISELPRCE